MWRSGIETSAMALPASARSAPSTSVKVERAAGQRLRLERDARVGARALDGGGELAIEAEPSGDRRAATGHLHAGRALHSAGHVRGVGHVHDDRDRRVDAMCGRTRAVAERLLDRACARDHRNRAAAALRDPAGCLEHDPGSGAIVERLAGELAVRELARLADEHGRVADVDERPCVIRVLRADVDPQRLDARSGRPVLRGEVDRKLPDNAGNQPPICCAQLDVLADEHLGVPAPERPDAQLAAVGRLAFLDVRDDQADLVDVAEQQHRRALCGPHGREARAEHVVIDAGEALGLRAPDLGRRTFVARRAVRAQELVQEAETFGGEVRHGRHTVSRASARAPQTPVRCMRAGNRCARGWNPR